LRAAGAARSAEADLIVTIGGGSVTDAGKIVALCLKHAADTQEKLDVLRVRYDSLGKPISAAYAGPDIRTVCVPTTLSGSEFNSLSGAYDEALRQKHGFEHRMMAPATVILDPAITVRTPHWLWLSTGMRAVDHAVETLVSRQSNDFYNGMAESALRLLSEALPRAKADPTDLACRLKCQLGAWQSMIPLLGGVPMGASHAIGHLLGAVSGVPHGYTSCVMCPVVQRWNAATVVEAQRRISACMGEPNEPAAAVLEHFVHTLGLPRFLEDVGVERADLPPIAEGTLSDIWGRTNPRPVGSAADVMEILSLALRNESSSPPSRASGVTR
jgi:alcohol dehydrogenase class IV